VQLLQIGMRLKGLHEGMTAPMFEPIALGEPLVWRYRGQVVPRNRQVDTEIEIIRIDRQADGRIVCTAKGTLWCDGLRIYEMPSVAVSLVDQSPCTPAIVKDGWRRQLGIADWPGEALMTALFRRFVSRVSFADPTAITALAGRPVLYLANHQTGIESILFSFALGGLTQRPIIAIAKGEHQESWIGRLYETLAAYPGVKLPRMALFFDRDDRASMLALMGEAGRLLQAEGYSMLVHVEGTRSTRAGEPVRRVSAVLLDLMAAAQVPIVPVRFAGGLPIDTANTGDVRREFPVGLGQQQIFIGRPIEIDVLRDLPLRDKQRVIADAINALGGPLASESPASPSPETEARVARLAARAHLDHAKAVVLDTLAQDPDAAPLFARIFDALALDSPSSTLTPWEQVFLNWATGQGRSR